MNKIIIYILSAMMLLVSCEKDWIPSASYLNVSSHSVSVSPNSVQVSCRLVSDAEFSEAYVEYSPDKGFPYSSTKSKKMTAPQSVRSYSSAYSATITGLKENTTYYFRYKAKDRLSGTMCTETYQCKTSVYSLPIVSTTSVTDVSYTSATVGGNVTSDGGYTVTERGVVYSTSQNPTTSNAKKTSGSGTGSFSLNLSGLSENTTYYVRAYAINSKGTSYGDQVSFTTQKNSSLPSVTTSSISNVSYTSATVSGNVTSDGGATVTERGVVYSTSPNPTTSNSRKSSGSGTGSFSLNLSGLSENTTYYVRAYATNSKGTSYGEQLSFTTKKNSSVPSVTTSSISNVSYTSATVSGNVASDGGSTVTERGVVYSTLQNPTISNNKKTSGSGTGSYSISLSGLSEGTTYYVRAYAINSIGAGYGEQVSFTTKTNSGTGGSGGSESNHEYVDLGLSVKWATCNVGASKPEDYGDYFAWGETSPKSTYNWSTYKWCNNSYNSLTKYCTSSSYGTVDNKTQLDLSDDAARVNWGGNWRMPTHDEFTELRTKCTWSEITQNGVYGYKVTSKTNGRSIFLPEAGYWANSSLGRSGSYGYYWSSSLDAGYQNLSKSVCFFTGYVDWHQDNRSNGLSVRPVCP